MLNELFEIERGLTAGGIAIEALHPDVNFMGKEQGFRVRLYPDGRMASVELAADFRTVWTLRDGNHNGFPGLKTAAGLLAIDSAALDAHNQIWDADENPARRQNELERLFDRYPIDSSQIPAWPSAGHRNRIRQRLDALRPLAGNPLTAAVPAVFERFLLGLDASPSFLEGLTEILGHRLRDRGVEWLEPIRNALVGPVALALDVAQGEFDRDAGDRRQTGPVSIELSTSSSTESTADCTPRCIMTGKGVPLHEGNFPRPKLPGPLALTYIFSRNSDIPSLGRFGRFSAASLPIGAEVARRLGGAISYLTREDGKGKTWRLIPSESDDKRDLLVIGLAASGLRLADAFADEDEVSGEAALKELGARVIDASDGNVRGDYGDDEVVILVLRAVDLGNRKAIFHRRTTPAQLRAAARLWQNATSNTPAWLGFHCPVKGTKEAVFRLPLYVTPLSITPLSRNKFVNGGQRKIPVIGVTAATAFGLFFREGNVGRRAENVLAVMLRRHGILLASLAAARNKGREYLKDFDPKVGLRHDALRSITWIGALLHYLGRKRETYMSEMAFRLGQLLAVADVVHIGYCADLRNGDVPPTLLGNSVLTLAGSNPARALSILQSRMKPYLAWAKGTDSIYGKANNEERRGNISRAIAMRQGASQARRAEEIANDIHTMFGPYEARGTPPDDAFKAELLLGYLAGLPRAKKAGEHEGSDEMRRGERAEGEQA